MEWAGSSYLELPILVVKKRNLTGFYGRYIYSIYIYIFGWFSLGELARNGFRGLVLGFFMGLFFHAY